MARKVWPYWMNQNSLTRTDSLQRIAQKGLARAVWQKISQNRLTRQDWSEMIARNDCPEKMGEKGLPGKAWSEKFDQNGLARKD